MSYFINKDKHSACDFYSTLNIFFNKKINNEKKP